MFLLQVAMGGGRTNFYPNTTTEPEYNKEKKHKRTFNDLQNITQKTKDRATRAPLGMNSGAPEGYAVPAPLVAPVVLT
jgi:hypothetical protein